MDRFPCGGYLAAAIAILACSTVLPLFLDDPTYLFVVLYFVLENLAYAMLVGLILRLVMLSGLPTSFWIGPLSVFLACKMMDNLAYTMVRTVFLDNLTYMFVVSYFVLEYLAYTVVVWLILTMMMLSVLATCQMLDNLMVSN